MEKIKINTINKKSEDIATFIQEEDIRLNNMIKNASNKIYEEKNEKPIVLLSGPSGSGKTTVAYKIEQCLKKKDTKTTVINMDNYFKPKEQELSPKEMEKPDRLDAELLVSDINKLIKGDSVYSPILNFKTGERTFSKIPFHKEEGEIIIIEGIHVLNPAVVGEIMNNANGLYVSPRTRIELRDGELFNPQKLRLLRRILRDVEHRGQTVESTITKSQHVDKGEDLYIMPHKNNAGIHINTFAAYEASILKHHLKEKIALIDNSIINEYNLDSVLKLFNEISEIEDDSLVSSKAILREFIGGSDFSY